MAEAWKESLKRIKRGEERERELKRNQTRLFGQPMRETDANFRGAYSVPHMPMIALEPTIRNLGTVIRDAAKLYATLLEATGEKKGAQHVRVAREDLFDYLGLPCNEEE